MTAVLDVAVLVVAKAPVAGQAKTRLSPPLSPREAARLAAAALLDTLAAAAAARVRRRIVALTGDLDRAESHADLAAALAPFDVLPQRGTGFAERLANAHHDAARRAGLPVLQLGGDTPQADSALLTDCAARLAAPGVDAVVGPAADGGWWALGLRADPPVLDLARVPMSTPHTGADTLAMLRRHRRATVLLPELVDVDRADDALLVAEMVGAQSRFGQVVADLGPKLRACDAGSGAHRCAHPEDSRS
ncbi:MAG TPA: DUF2064 domain-containing protein [Aldersonia sp.]